MPHLLMIRYRIPYGSVTAVFYVLEKKNCLNLEAPSRAPGGAWGHEGV